MNKKIIWSLFSGSGIDVLPWAKAGHKCYCFNYDDADHGDYEGVKEIHPNITYVNAFIDIEWMENVENLGLPAPDLILAYPPCTDMAVSGSRHFASKKAKDPFFQVKAVRTAKIAAWLAEFVFDCPYMIENPVSVLAGQWRKPTVYFNPWEYGGYLPVNDVNPYFPQYIKPRDAYPKKTGLWTGNGFIIPKTSPVPVAPGWSDQQNKLGGKSARTKMIRSLTPRGLAEAIYQYNK
ncbi:hypothetical protein A71_165 [Escherichia phage A7_1]|uniref:Uncharacterized protein n=1 Tax=Escherichia phage A5-4 TaxID=2996162 RepID=A0AAE9PXS4_9CAUD|nr:hypothetical protein A71_165 [Escherichia phage A7_1]UZZ64247.1 hypothetical protein A54_7 [Escherichia phage A5-4]